MAFISNTLRSTTQQLLRKAATTAPAMRREGGSMMVTANHLPAFPVVASTRHHYHSTASALEVVTTDLNAMIKVSEYIIHPPTLDREIG